VSTYLVVLDKPVPVQSLRFGLLDFVSDHKAAELVLLQIPQRLPVETEEEARRAARENATSARSLLTAMGLPVVDALVGDPLPKKAIAAEIQGGRRSYDGILLAGAAPGLLRMFRFDLAHQLERKFRLPVTYVSPEPAQANPAA
jgi:hypothetical protein